MNFIIQTPVNTNADEVLSKFDADLFVALKPPFMPLELKRFDGCKAGDKVHLCLGKKPFLQYWDALVTEHGEENDYYYFIDIGERLPFPLKRWTHLHKIYKKENGSIIEDNITFHSPFKLLDFLLYPFLYFMFYLRKKVYRNYFQ